MVFDPGNWILKTHSTIVPVELTSFSAELNNDVVNLSWTTATEVNNQGFEIQRKLDAIMNGLTIGFNEGKWNNNRTKLIILS